MKRIVTYVHRPKRARKKAQAAAIATPAIVIAKAGKRWQSTRQIGDGPNMTPEEHKRRCDAADALWRELVRRVREE